VYAPLWALILLFPSARLNPLFITFQQYPYSSNILELHVTRLDPSWAPLTYVFLLIYSYLHAHDMIRGITGYGTGHGPYIAIHDGFAGMAQWANFLPDSDRIALDVHPYLAFTGSTQATVIAADGSPFAAQACGWGSDMYSRYGFSGRTGEIHIT
jgi:hypothetical protein